jgi:hypothetical protein
MNKWYKRQGLLTQILVGIMAVWLIFILYCRGAAVWNDTIGEERNVFILDPCIEICDTWYFWICIIECDFFE